MADIEFIKKDPEQILADTIAEYQRQAEMKLNPADPEMLLINCMAYRETVLRGQMEYLMRQNFVQFATGENLDKWGHLWGVNRKAGETDDEYRLRILSVAKGSIGTVAAYYARIMAVTGVSDILIVQKHQDNTLPPGVIRLVPIQQKVSDNMVDMGCVHTPGLERAILDSILVADFGIISPVFVFRPASPIAVNGSIEVRPVLGFDKDMLRRNVEIKVEEYFGTLSRKFENYFGVFDLEEKVLQAEGVVNVINMNFNSVPSKATGDFYVQGQIKIV